MAEPPPPGTGGSPVPIGGTCDPAFGPVAEAFAANFAEGEVGAAVCVTVAGRPVVNLWGGWADEAHTRPWAETTTVNVYSVGKPLIGLRLLQLVAAGRVDLDARADRYWPELRAGQAGATVRAVLSHRAGVPALRPPLTDDDLWDWTVMAGAVAATEPWWEPGTRHAYHTNTFGHLVGGLAHRVDGRRPGRWLRDDVAGPLGAALAWGLTPAEQARCADVIWLPGRGRLREAAGPPGGPAEGSPAGPARSTRAAWADLDPEMVMLGYTNPPGYSSLGVVNTPAWRSAEVPSTNLHATAAGVARLYTALAGGGTVDGVAVIDPAMLAEATTAQSEGWCPVLQREVTFGLGFQLTRPDRPFGPNPGAFGHFGTGGSLGYADPDAGIGFGYVMNAVNPGWQSTRNRALLDALYRCL
ncbi:MAG: serine hydrolase domain-containing protein [Acidimicrobiales bacterium]